jgi:hypothetical protein
MGTRDDHDDPFLSTIERDELIHFRNWLKQDYAQLQETSRVLRRESQWLREASRQLRRSNLQEEIS